MKKLQDIGMHLQIETWKRTAKVINETYFTVQRW